MGSLPIRRTYSSNSTSRSSEVNRLSLGQSYKRVPKCRERGNMMSVRSSRRQRIVITITIVQIALLFLSTNRTGRSAFAEDSVQVPDVPPVPKMIAGKPYSVIRGESPGTWAVKWGDQSMLWKPQSWMEDRQQRLGPAFLAQWTTPGLPLPFDIPIEKKRDTRE